MKTKSSKQMNNIIKYDPEATKRKVAHIDVSSLNPNKKKRPLRCWKGVELVHGLMVKAIDEKHIKPGDEIKSEFLEEIIIKNNLHMKWNLIGNPKDKFGLRRTIGDAVGKHGLNLKHGNRRNTFVVPHGLPAVIGDAVYTEPVY